MQNGKITAAFFSPTGNTGLIVRMIAGEITCFLQENQETGAALKFEEDDFTLPAARQALRSFGSEDLVILGTPTYAGRVPNKIAPEISRLFHGEGTPVVPVVTFGNRSYDNSLAELTDIRRQNGFVPVGAVAVCMPHVFSDVLGAGRPDAGDRALLKEFARAVCAALTGEEAAGGSQCAAEEIQSASEEMLSAGGCFRHLQVPGSPEAPYYTPLGTDGKPAKFLKASPKVDPALCRHCGTCAAVCPMGSVSKDDPAVMNGICIKCQACIRRCPAGARFFDDAAFLSHVAMLEQTYTRRAGSEIFVVPDEQP